MQASERAGKGSEAELAFDGMWRLLGGPDLRREVRFAAEHVGLGPGVRDRLVLANLRDWRLDFAHDGARVAIEVEGGVYSKGRHVRPGGFEEDAAKYNAAAILGWLVFRVTPQMVERDPVGVLGPIIETIERREHAHTDGGL